VSIFCPDKSEIFWAVVGKCDILVRVRKVCTLWCEESEIFLGSGRKV